MKKLIAAVALGAMLLAAAPALAQEYGYRSYSNSYSASAPWPPPPSAAQYWEYDYYNPPTRCCYQPSTYYRPTPCCSGISIGLPFLGIHIP